MQYHITSLVSCFVQAILCLAVYVLLYCGLGDCDCDLVVHLEVPSCSNLPQPEEFWFPATHDVFIPGLQE
jgi:hypothetical protein